jgi:hypothetical protein
MAWARRIRCSSVVEAAGVEFEGAGWAVPGRLGGEQHASCPPPQLDAGRGCEGLSACRADCEVEFTHGKLEVMFGPESLAVHVVVVGGADLLQIVKAGGDPRGLL